MIEIKKKPIKAKNYTYEIETIQRYIKLVLFYSLSLNSASRILPLIHNLKRQPSINSGKMWMLKLGYYNLTKEQTIADDLDIYNRSFNTNGKRKTSSDTWYKNKRFT